MSVEGRSFGVIIMFRVTSMFWTPARGGTVLGRPHAIICLLVLGCSCAPTASPQDIQDDGGEQHQPPMWFVALSSEQNGDSNGILDIHRFLTVPTKCWLMMGEVGFSFRAERFQAPPSSSDEVLADDGGSGVSSEQSDSESLNPNNVTISQPLTIEVFSANDVEDSVTEAILASLNLAANMWGLYWPVEYWVMGLDPEAGEELVDKFCSRREERDEWDYKSCMAREAGSEQHSMIEYQQLGAQAVAENRAFGTAGHNGGFDWGIHRFTTTLPWGLAGRFGTPGAEDVRTCSSRILACGPALVYKHSRSR